MNTNAEASDSIEEKRVMNILDVTDYCLQHIFMYLSQDDLLKIATITPRFAIPTKLVFRKRFGQKLIKVSDSIVERFMIDVLLKQFGDEITKLRVSFDYIDELDRLLVAIDEDCSEKLIEIEFVHYAYRYTSPLAYQNDLKKIRLFLQQLPTKYPNLQRLEFKNYFILKNGISLEDLDQHLPNLTQFSFDGQLSLGNLKNFIETHRKLEYLRVISKSRTYLNYDFIVFISAMLPQLQFLEISGFYFLNIHKMGQTELIQFNKLETLIIDGQTFSSLFCPNDESSGIQLKKLESLSITTSYWPCSLSQISNLISRNEQLTSIFFTYEIFFDGTAFQFWDLFENEFWFHICNAHGIDIDKFSGTYKHKFNGKEWQIECCEDDNTVTLKRIGN